MIEPSSFFRMDHVPPLEAPVAADPALMAFPTTMLRSNQKEYGVWKYELHIDGGHVSGVLDGEEATLVNIEVTEKLSHTGRGRYLVKAFAREMHLRGATNMLGRVVSPAAMHNRLRIFGLENLVLTERLAPGVELPLTGEQAVASLVRYRQHLALRPKTRPLDLRRMSPAIDCLVDLTSPDVLERIYTTGRD